MIRLDPSPVYVCMCVYVGMCSVRVLGMGNNTRGSLCDLALVYMCMCVYVCVYVGMRSVSVAIVREGPLEIRLDPRPGVCVYVCVCGYVFCERAGDRKQHTRVHV